MALGLGKVLACGQVRLPRDVRRAADIKPGDTVSFRVNNGVVEIRPLPMTLERVAETVPHRGGPTSLPCGKRRRPRRQTKSSA